MRFQLFRSTTFPPLIAVLFLLPFLILVNSNGVSNHGIIRCFISASVRHLTVGGSPLGRSAGGSVGPLVQRAARWMAKEGGKGSEENFLSTTDRGQSQEGTVLVGTLA